MELTALIVDVVLRVSVGARPYLKHPSTLLLCRIIEFVTVTEIRLKTHGARGCLEIAWQLRTVRNDRRIFDSELTEIRLQRRATRDLSMLPFPVGIQDYLAFAFPRIKRCAEYFRYIEIFNGFRWRSGAPFRRSLFFSCFIDSFSLVADGVSLEWTISKNQQRRRL